MKIYEYSMVACAALAQGLFKHCNKCKSKRFVKVFLQKKLLYPRKKKTEIIDSRENVFF